MSLNYIFFSVCYVQEIFCHAQVDFSNTNEENESFTNHFSAIILSL